MNQGTQRRLAAIVAADIVEFSRLIGRDEEGTLKAFRLSQAELIDPLIAEHNGRIANTAGDSFLLEFPSVVDAVRCSIAVQEGMAARNLDIPPDRHISFRVGINVGDVIANGEDLLGDGVNIAARLEALCEPGGITLSDDAYRQVRDRLKLSWEDGGEQELKNIARPVNVWHWSGTAETKAVDSGAENEALPLPEKPSIAVLPFDNMSGDPAEEYFSDGITEDLTTALSRFDGLFVIARNSAFTYKGQAVDVQRVGRELGVRYVLEGSVRRAGDRVRVNAQLIDVDANRHVWAERFDRQMDDVFELQDDIVASIAATVGPEITQAEIERARGKRPDTLDTWDIYLQAVAALQKMTEDAVAEAISLLKRAIEAEPEFANAHALLSQCHVHIATNGWVRPVSKAFEEARRLAEEAVALGPSSPETNHTLAYVLMMIGEAELAIVAARRAIDLNPNHAEAYAVLGLSLVFFGQIEEGLAACLQSARNSPRDARGSVVYPGLGHAYLMLGDYEQAVAEAKKGLLRSPLDYGPLVILATSTAYLGREAEAARYIDELLRLIPRYSLTALRKNPMFIQSEHIDKLVEGMRLAGLPE